MTDILDKLEGEEWRLHIIGVYVSNLGRVYAPKSGKNPSHYTYGSLNGRGYLNIRWNYKNYLVHRLVAECFIPNPNNYKEIDHINRNRTDNRVENLRWANRSVNLKNREVPKNIASSKKVLMIDKDSNQVIKVWESTMECHRNGFNQGAVSACCLNKYTEKSPNIYKGYIWKYT